MDREACSHWKLQKVVEQLLDRVSPKMFIPIVYTTGPVEWDEECVGLGRAGWRCHLTPLDHALVDSELLDLAHQ